MLNFSKSFLIGVIAAVFALAFEIVLSFAFPEKIVSNAYFQELTWLLIGIVIIEEVTKAFFITKSFAVIKTKHFFLISLNIGLGFGLSEIFLKNTFQNDPLSLIIFLALFLHIFTAAIIGLNFSKDKNPSPQGLVGALFFNIILHLSYNLLIIYFF